MLDEYSIVSFNPNDVSEQLLDAYLIFDEKITLELIPEQGLTSIESRKKNLKILNPTRDYAFWVASIPVAEILTVVGSARMSILNKNSPDYEQNGHITRCSILVLSDFTNQGIGTALLDKITEQAMAYNQITDLMFNTYNASGYSFFEKHGAKLALEQNRSYLNLSEVDLNMMNSWNSLGNELAAKDKIKLVEITGSIPDDIIDEYASLYTEIINQQPLGSLQLRHVITVDTFRTRAEQMKKMDQQWHTILTIEHNGQISGLTEFQYSSNQPDMIFQLLTGVKDEYRKRGIGKWLKAKMLLFMMENYPSAKYIETSNTVTNAAMISINTRMGFYDKEPLKFYELKIR
ncbi:MAG: GNAT family N-acetyltransferase [Candidatus Heimdallarchaeota archaeon]|nr:GNAT family N-acetyltransferase [Candidatus Heimdallarchaeota archaeon]